MNIRFDIFVKVNLDFSSEHIMYIKPNACLYSFIDPDNVHVNYRDIT